MKYSNYKDIVNDLFAGYKQAISDTVNILPNDCKLSTDDEKIMDELWKFADILNIIVINMIAEDIYFSGYGTVDNMGYDLWMTRSKIHDAFIDNNWGNYGNLLSNTAKSLDK